MKKTLLIIAALTVSFVLSSSDFKGEPMEEHPSFVMVQAAEAFERYQAWKGDDETVVFPILTDLHSHDIYTYQHIGYIAKDRVQVFTDLWNEHDCGDFLEVEDGKAYLHIKFYR